MQPPLIRGFHIPEPREAVPERRERRATRRLLQDGFPAVCGQNRRAALRPVGHAAAADDAGARWPRHRPPLRERQCEYVPVAVAQRADQLVGLQVPALDDAGAAAVEAAVVGRDGEDGLGVAGQGLDQVEVAQVVQLDQAVLPTCGKIYNREL
jgi:hypothetical protein